MLKALQAALGTKPKAEAQLTAEDITAAAQAAVAELRGEFDAYKTTADAAMAEAAEKLTSLTAQLEAANALIGEYRAAAEAAEAGKAQAEADALVAKLTARKEKLLASIGTERTDALLKATDGMDDASFDAVAAALGVGIAAEAASPLFNEVGADAQVNAAQVTDEETPEMKALKARYAPK